VDRILQNIKIVLTRAKNQSVETIKQLEELGANVISLPTIKIYTITGDDSLDESIKNISKYNSLIFTSENAVRCLFEKIDELRIDFNPKAYFVISIGEKTSKVCKEKGFRIDFQSKSSTSESLLKELGYIDLIGRKILIPNSILANPIQFKSLEDHGAIVDALPIYNNRSNDSTDLINEINELKNTEIDLYIFTSPSTFNGFVEVLKIKEPKEFFSKKNIAVIGPVTKEALIKSGVKPNIIPDKYTMNYLIEEIKLFYSKKNQPLDKASY